MKQIYKNVITFTICAYCFGGINALKASEFSLSPQQQEIAKSKQSDSEIDLKSKISKLRSLKFSIDDLREGKYNDEKAYKALQVMVSKIESKPEYLKQLSEIDKAHLSKLKQEIEFIEAEAQNKSDGELKTIMTNISIAQLNEAQLEKQALQQQKLQKQQTALEEKEQAKQQRIQEKQAIIEARKKDEIEKQKQKELSKIRQKENELDSSKEDLIRIRETKSLQLKDVEEKLTKLNLEKSTLESMNVSEKKEIRAKNKGISEIDGQIYILSQAKKSLETDINSTQQQITTLDGNLKDLALQKSQYVKTADTQIQSADIQSPSTQYSLITNDLQDAVNNIAQIEEVEEDAIVAESLISEKEFEEDQIVQSKVISSEDDSNNNKIIAASYMTEEEKALFTPLLAMTKVYKENLNNYENAILNNNLAKHNISENTNVNYLIGTGINNVALNKEIDTTIKQQYIYLGLEHKARENVGLGINFGYEQNKFDVAEFKDIKDNAMYSSIYTKISNPIININGGLIISSSVNKNKVKTTELDGSFDHINSRIFLNFNKDFYFTDTLFIVTTAKLNFNTFKFQNSTFTNGTNTFGIANNNNTMFSESFDITLNKNILTLNDILKMNLFAGFNFNNTNKDITLKAYNKNDSATYNVIDGYKLKDYSYALVGVNGKINKNLDLNLLFKHNLSISNDNQVNANLNVSF